MQYLEGQLLLSATDLVGHLGCEHLVTLELGAVRGEWRRPKYEDPERDLLRKKGFEHEHACLEAFEKEGRSVSRLTPAPAKSLDQLRAEDRATQGAMAAGADVIYQGTFFDGRWGGRPDFLVRVEEPSRLWQWSYEPADAKLAGHVHPQAILQLCVYADRLAQIQGREPQRIGVITGDGAPHWHRLRDYSAYFRSAKATLESRLAKESPPTYPNPVDHCRVCNWFQVCANRRRADDHLCRVAGITRTQTKRLVEAGVPTLAELAQVQAGARIEDVTKVSLDRLRLQARLQQQQYQDGKVRYELIQPDPEEPNRGLALLPEPSPADIFFDIEKDEWAGSDGLEYLFGIGFETGGRMEYQPLWAHSAEDEKRALEDFIDLVNGRLQDHPLMHVYHYGAYEESALKRLVTRHGTRQDALDRILRGGVLVDLYAVVRQGVRVSQESYSLKKVEKLYMADREGPVTRPGFAVVEYERWLESRDEAILRGIADYNRDDCLSTWKLRAWLEEKRLEAQAIFQVSLARPATGEAAPSEAKAAQSEETRVRVEALLKDVPADRAERTPEQHSRWLLAHLLDWHRREANPEWWRYFSLLRAPMEELVASAEALGDLEYVGEVGKVKRSVLHRYRHDLEQEHKFKTGDKPIDPATEEPAGEVVAVDDAAGTIDLKRGGNSTTPHPKALIPERPLRTDTQRDALRRLADHVMAHGIEGPGQYQSVRDLLLRTAPRVNGLTAGAPILVDGLEPLDLACHLALNLADSYLPVQGPPGSGKTYTAARMILALLEKRKKVGIAATAHKAITNLVDEVCAASRKAPRSVRIVQRAEQEDGSTQPEVTVTSNNEVVVQGLATGEFEVAAGTPWLFSREDMTGSVDVLFVDEAGQMSLANVLAMGGAARSVVLLGDPNQLPQVTKASHPEGTGVSALEHVLGESLTIPSERGLFLEKTWRLHPEICDYVSEAFYEGRLDSHDSTQHQRLEPGSALDGSGIFLSRIPHQDNSSRSPEEASAIVELIASLLGRTWTDKNGRQRLITLDDILIVAPYNVQVAEISKRLQQRFQNTGRVGTVDKFQGQEGAIAIYSTATSSPDDAPRDVEFLYSRNRLNVAVSRARAAAVLVSSPDLFRIRCRSLDQMRMANAFCLMTERARIVATGKEVPPLEMVS